MTRKIKKAGKVVESTRTKLAAVEKRALLDTVMSNMQEYATLTIENRAVPDFRDGLKPVHRRLLWTGYTMNLWPDKGTVKAAAIVGRVIGSFHPHGSCLSGRTRVPLTNGEYPTIKELYDSGKKEFEILSYDEISESIVAAKATLFRKGRKTDSPVEFTLLDGSKFTSTDDHRFYVRGKGWTKAKNLKRGDVIESASLEGNRRGYVRLESNNRSGSLHRIVYEDIKGEIPESFHVHHKDMLKDNNSSKNLVALSNSDHRIKHADDEEPIEALARGRDAMFEKNGKFRSATKQKNKELMREHNKWLWLIKAVKVASSIVSEGKKINANNYNAKKTEVYNLTKWETLAKKGVNEETLLTLSKHYLETGSHTFFDASKATGLTTKVHEKSIEQTPDLEDSELDRNDRNAFLEKVVSETFANIIKKGLVISNKTYESTAKSMTKSGNRRSNVKATTWNNLDRLLNYYNVADVSQILKKLPSYRLSIVKSIKTLNLEKEMTTYDFSVAEYENMLIGEKGKALIVAHNSSAYDALVTLVNFPTQLYVGQGNWGIPALGLSPAAERYTEAKLSDFTRQIILNERYMPIVEKVPNFDGSALEPVLLPATLPIVLINGARGIAVGTTTCIPSFTAESVSILIREAIKRSKESGKLVPVTVADCIKHLVFSNASGGHVVSPKSDIVRMMKTGEGRIAWSCDYKAEPDKKRVTITGIAPDWNFESKYTMFQGLNYVRQIHNLSATGKFKIVIELKPTLSKAEVAHSIEDIEKKLQSAMTYRINVTKRKVRQVDGVPDVTASFASMTIPDLINNWLAWRINLEKRAAEHELATLRVALRREEVMLVAITHLDIIFAILKDKSIKDKDVVLAKKLKITLEESKSIWATAVGRLDKLTEHEVELKIKKLKEEITRAETDFKKPITASLRESTKVFNKVFQVSKTAKETVQ